VDGYFNSASVCGTYGNGNLRRMEQPPSKEIPRMAETAGAGKKRRSCIKDQC